MSAHDTLKKLMDDSGVAFVLETTAGLLRGKWRDSNDDCVRRILAVASTRLLKLAKQMPDFNCDED